MGTYTQQLSTANPWSDRPSDVATLCGTHQNSRWNPLK